MDIAKIRKKALSKKMEDKAAEVRLPDESPPAEEHKKEYPDTEHPFPAQDRPETGGAAGDEDGSGIEPQAEHQAGPEVGAEEETDIIHGEAVQEMVELLTFSISSEEYAFRVPEVEEVLRFQQITSVPTVPDYVLGITSLRGKIIPVIDLKKRLNLEKKTPDIINPSDAGNGEKKELGKKIVIVDGPKGLIGAMIDKVVGVVRLPLSQVLPPPGHLNEAGLAFIEGIIVLNKRFISVIHSDTAMDIEAG